MVTGRSDNTARLFNLAHNGTTLAGIALTTVSGLAIVTFLIVNLLGGLEESPYIGMFAYVILPFIFVVGLLLIPLGMHLRRRRLLRSGVTDEELSAYPKLDFNDPRLRRLATAFLGLTAANAVILGSISFLAVEYSETVTFCGQTCHTVMQPEYTAYSGSPHSRVACVDCHIGPGASWFVRSKLDGLRQVWHTFRNTYHRPIQTPLETLRPARETCEQCHWPNKHHGDKLRVFARFSSDEANTPSYTAMLLKTGGGSLDLGSHGGIHWWHIYSDNRIRYIAGDERREEIVWVELTTPSGEVRVYSRDDAKAPATDEVEQKARIMDCIDCHNRPTHLFREPDWAIDDILERDSDLRTLPFFKREAVRAVKGDYPSHAEGVAAVHQAIVDFYRKQSPKLSATDSDLVERGAAAAAETYGRTVFPAMKTNWETHPNHIGHETSPGCWRCHDDEMTTADGQHVIPMDCDTCHVFLVEDATERPDLAALASGL
jgi:hypothetical protein